MNEFHDVVIDVGKKEFSAGLTFVACSRVRYSSESNLYFTIVHYDCVYYVYVYSMSCIFAFDLFYKTSSVALCSRLR